MLGRTQRNHGRVKVNWLSKRKGDKMYHCTIENDGLKYTRLSKDEYVIDEPILIFPEGIPPDSYDWNGENITVFSQDVYGTVVGCTLLREGDRIDGDTVFKIYEDRVEFEKNGKRWTKECDVTYPAWR